MTEYIVCHDADSAGRAGAQVWSQAVANQAGQCKIIDLPFTEESMDGNGNQKTDLRDWLNDGNSFSDFLKLASRSIDREGDNTSGVRYAIEEEMMRRLGLDVLGATCKFRVSIWSDELKMTVKDLEVRKMTMDNFDWLCGDRAQLHIHRSNEDIEDSYPLTQVKRAIARLCSARPVVTEYLETGQGVWLGHDNEDQHETIVLVSSKEAARMNGELAMVTSPRVDKLMIDMGSAADRWYNFDVLSEYCTLAKDPEWCGDVIQQGIKYFGQWRWKHADSDPELITGLIIATWIQTLWKWRPQVAVVGETNSGKSFLFKSLGGLEAGLEPGIFGMLSFLTSQSSEAGIRQHIANRACVVLIDEFDSMNGKEQEKTLSLIRTSSRRDIIAKGTSNQTGHKYALRHICWIAGIYDGLKDQADKNRFINFELLRKADSTRSIEMMPSEQAVDLGQKLLAIGIVHGLAMRDAAHQMRNHNAEGIDPRQIENYSVPVAALNVPIGSSKEETAESLDFMLQRIEKDSLSSQHVELMNDIMAAQVNCGRGEIHTVGQIIESAQLFTDYSEVLQANGIRYFQGDEFEEASIFIAHGRLPHGLLRSTEWRKSLDQILLRTPGARRDKQRCGAANRALNGVRVPVVEG